MEKRGIVMGPKWDEKRAIARTMRSSMTNAERDLWQGLRGNRCGGLHFRRQQVIDGFIADFYCHSAGLIVEADGGIHTEQADYDLLRDHTLAARGLRVLRFTNERLLSELPSVLSEILHAAQTPSDSAP